MYIHTHIHTQCQNIVQKQSKHNTHAYIHKHSFAYQSNDFGLDRDRPTHNLIQNKCTYMHTYTSIRLHTKVTTSALIATDRRTISFRTLCSRACQQKSSFRHQYAANITNYDEIHSLVCCKHHTHIDEIHSSVCCKHHT